MYDLSIDYKQSIFFGKDRYYTPDDFIDDIFFNIYNHDDVGGQNKVGEGHIRILDFCKYANYPYDLDFDFSDIIDSDRQIFNLFEVILNESNYSSCAFEEFSIEGDIKDTAQNKDLFSKIMSDFILLLNTFKIDCKARILFENGKIDPILIDRFTDYGFEGIDAGFETNNNRFVEMIRYLNPKPPVTQKSMF
jgi:hypothetical protein